jgi:hypothetical protein
MHFSVIKLDIYYLIRSTKKYFDINDLVFIDLNI